MKNMLFYVIITTGDSMYLIIKKSLLILLFILSLLNIFFKFNYSLFIILIVILIINVIYELILYNGRVVVNASLGWYIFTKENIMLVLGIILTGLNIYNILDIRYLWLILNIIILIFSLINDKNRKNRIY